MRRLFTILAVVFALVFVTGTSSSSASAYYNYWTYPGGATCADNTFLIPLSQYYNIQAGYYRTTIGVTGIFSQSNSGKENAQSGTIPNMVMFEFFNPTKAAYTFYMTWTLLDANHNVYYTASVTMNCSVSRIATVSVSYGDGGTPGRPIPSEFVLRTITCNTPLYDSAGGAPIASGEAIKAGQTWFISPTPVKDAKGKLWTELFASGFSDGFVPTSCVGGAPAGYAGN